MGMTGEMIKELSYITTIREIEAWEGTSFNLEDKLLDLESIDSISTVNSKRTPCIINCIEGLSTKIKETNKKCLIFRLHDFMLIT